MNSGSARPPINSELIVDRCRISCRPVQAADRCFLKVVYASSREDELAPVPWSKAEKEAFLQMQFDAQDTFYHNHYPGAEFLVITTPTEAIGRIYLHRREKEIRIMDITLLPQWRNRGIGTALFQQLFKEAGETDRTVTIHVETFNPAKRLYERLGFKETAQKGVYYLMEWTLKSTG